MRNTEGKNRYRGYIRIREKRRGYWENRENLNTGLRWTSNGLIIDFMSNILDHHNTLYLNGKSHSLIGNYILMFP